METRILIINRKRVIQNQNVDFIDDLFKTLINAAIYACRCLVYSCPSSRATRQREERARKLQNPAIIILIMHL
jgi:hypothetical protein